MDKILADKLSSMPRGLFLGHTKLNTYSEALMSIGWTPDDVLPGTDEFLNCLYTLCRSTKTRDMFTGTNAYSGEPVNVPPEFLEVLRKTCLSAISKCGKNLYHVVDLYRQYNRKLMNKGDIRDYSSCASMDVIDVTAITNKRMTNSEEARQLNDNIYAYTAENLFYATIPCLKSARLIVNEALEIVYDTIHIDLDKEELQLRLTSYFRKNATSIGEVIPISEMFVTIYRATTETDDGEKCNVVSVKNVCNIDLVAILRSNVRSMRWNKDDRVLWNQVYVKFIQGISEIDSEENMSSDCVIDMISFYSNSITAVNYLLSTKQVRAENRRKVEGVNAYDDDAQHKKRVRKVDLVTFISEDVPRESTRANIIRYKVASWGVCGHLRHYKDGKVVYVKPHVSHRKCMGDLAYCVKPAQKEIKFETGEANNGYSL